MILTRKERNRKFLILKIFILTFIIICFNYIGNVHRFSNNVLNFDQIKSFEKTKPKISKISPKIYINNNWTDVKAAGICIGSGTSSDPYIIQNLEIDAGGTDFCITIENSQEYFEIKNCTLANNGSSSLEGGIFLNNITNGKIKNNSISLNGPTWGESRGINVRSSSSFAIQENIIQQTGISRGIHLFNSSFITISLNNISGGSYSMYIYSCNFVNITQNIDIFNSISLNYCNYNIISQNNASGSNYFIIINSCNNTDIKNNFAIDSIDSAINSWYSYNTNILGNRIFNYLYDGITLFYSNKTIIENNTINNCVSNGIYSYYSSFNNISHNKISNCENGVNLEFGKNNSILNNSIYTCDIGVKLYKSNYNYVIENKVVDSKDRSVSSEYCDYLTISNNKLTNNKSTNNHGIFLYETDDTHIDYNFIKNCTYTGIYTHYSNYNNISNNIISNCKNGINLIGSYSISELFRVTNYLHTNTEDLDDAVKDEFGPAYRIADWNDILIFRDNIQEWASEVHMAHGDNYLITWNDQHFSSGNNHYFIERLDHNTPPWTAHDHIDNHFISLGSEFFISKYILAFHETPPFLDNSSDNSNNNTISKNKIFNCENGIKLNLSSNNYLINNSIYNNNIGVKLYKSHNNLIIKDFIKENGENIIQEFCEGNMIVYWNATVEAVKKPLDLGPIIRLIIILSIIVSFLAVSIIVVKKAARFTAKKKREREKERVLSMKIEEEETKREEEEEQLNSIPHLERFSKQFIYQQFRNVEKRLPKIPPSQVDEFFKNSLKKRISLFYNALDSLGYKLSLYQEGLLFDKCYDDSVSIRKDLAELLEKQEAERKLEEQRRKTAEAFGEEITSTDLMEKMEKLKPIDEKINDLLQSYERWEGRSLIPDSQDKINFPLISPKKVKKGNYKIFLSYSTQDSDYFEIPKIAEHLKKYEEIDDVLFWERDSGENIVEYMEKALRKCNVFILYCSENSLQSQAVNDEWQAAFQMRKKQILKIIPVYEKEENIPRVLWHLLNVKYTKDNFEGFIKKLFKEISRPL